MKKTFEEAMLDALEEFNNDRSRYSKNLKMLINFDVPQYNYSGSSFNVPQKAKNPKKRMADKYFKPSKDSLF
jgi:hypothetical protein